MNKYGIEIPSKVFQYDLRADIPKWITLFEEKEYDDPWERNDQAEQSQENEDIPIGRYRHESVVFGKYIVMVGGGTAHGVFDINNVYFFDTVNHRWIKKIVTGWHFVEGDLGKENGN